MGGTQLGTGGLRSLTVLLPRSFQQRPHQLLKRLLYLRRSSVDAVRCWKGHVTLIFSQSTSFTSAASSGLGFSVQEFMFRQRTPFADLDMTPVPGLSWIPSAV